MRQIVAAALIATFIGLSACSSESKLTTADLEICLSLLELEQVGGFKTDDILKFPFDEYSLKASSGLERVAYWRHAADFLRLLAMAPWQNSRMKRLAREAESLQSGGDETFKKSLNPDEWRLRLVDAEEVARRTLEACEL